MFGFGVGAAAEKGNISIISESWGTVHEKTKTENATANNPKRDVIGIGGNSGISCIAYVPKRKRFPTALGRNVLKLHDTVWLNVVYCKQAAQPVCWAGDGMERKEETL